MVKWFRLVFLMAIFSVSFQTRELIDVNRNDSNQNIDSIRYKHNPDVRLHQDAGDNNNESVYITESNSGFSSFKDVRTDEEFPHRIPNKHPLLFDWTASCRQCEPERCEATPDNCPYGLIRDACDCCYVCGNLEDTPCDLPGSKFRFGKCGEGLVCVQLRSLVNSEMTSEGYCTCPLSTVVCGSDTRTYSNPCQFKRASSRKRNLTKLHDGPCLSAPIMEIPPMNQSAETGSAAVFSCTVSGYPFAWFEWLKEEESVFQPGLSDGFTVQIRSGPLKYQITTWLEIKRTKQLHTGSFTCIAKNKLGTVNATAYLEVIEDNFDVTNYYVFRGRHYKFIGDDANVKNKTLKTINANVQPIVNDAKSDVNVSASITNQPQSVINNNTGTDVDSDVSQGYEVSQMDPVDEELVRTLKELVKPKDFRDIFFDDDEYSDGSGNQEK